MQKHSNANKLQCKQQLQCKTKLQCKQKLAIVVVRPPSPKPLSTSREA